MSEKKRWRRVQQQAPRTSQWISTFRSVTCFTILPRLCCEHSIAGGSVYQRQVELKKGRYPPPSVQSS